MLKMKALFLAVLLFCAAAVKAGEDIDDDKDGFAPMRKILHDECRKQTGVAEDLITGANKGVFAEDNKLKCYMQCVFDGESSMDDEGIIDPEILLAEMSPEMQAIYGDIFKACVNEPGVDFCDKAFNVNKCFYKQNPQLYHLV